MCECIFVPSLPNILCSYIHIILILSLQETRIWIKKLCGLYVVSLFLKGILGGIHIKEFPMYFGKSGSSGSLRSRIPSPLFNPLNWQHLCSITLKNSALRFIVWHTFRMATQHLWLLPYMAEESLHAQLIKGAGEGRFILPCLRRPLSNCKSPNKKGGKPERKVDNILLVYTWRKGHMAMFSGTLSELEKGRQGGLLPGSPPK